MKIIEQKTVTPALCEFVQRLCAQLYSTPPVVTEESLRRLAESENSHLLVLYDDQGEPAGMTTVGVYHTPGGIRAWIEDVVVDEARRGHGLSKPLVQEAIALARRCGAQTLALTSNPSRVAANALYRSMGFAVYETNFYKMEL